MSISRHIETVQVVSDVQSEVERAYEKFKPFNSAHEGYAVIFEELDELWAEVRKKKAQRNVELMYHESIQVAAMAVRFAVDICRQVKMPDGSVDD